MNLLPKANKQAHAPIYKIKIKGHLDREWISWFEGMSFNLEEDGNTLLEGPIIDQAALYGILKKVHQLGLQLISINKIEAEEDDTIQKGGKE